ncbi:MAG: hypothetical protein JNL38_05155 [Myxococcales bacterium]|nr:hypothetical protein [Myxococcales bacterium]
MDDDPLAMKVPLRLAVCALAPLAPAACADEPEDAPMTVWVYEEPASPGDPDHALAGAKVAIDPPGGGARIFTVTEADGHVTVRAPFERGGAHVTAVTPDHTLVTLLDVSPTRASARPNTFGKPASDVVVVLPRLDKSLRAASVEVRGAIVGKAAPDDTLNVTASGLARLGAVETSDSSYALRGPRGRPFFLLGRESGPFTDDGSIAVEPLVKAFRVDVPSPSGDVNVDLDLKALPPVATRIVHIRAEIPAGGALGAKVRGSAAILSAESRLLVGAFRRTAPSADGRALDFEVDAIDTDLAGEHAISRGVLIGDRGAQSIRAELGVVADGTVWSDFAAPPAAPEGPRTLADPIPLDGFPPGADLEVQVGGGGKVFWLLRAAPSAGSKTVTIPPQFDVSFGVSIPETVLLYSVKIVAKLDRIPLPPHGELYRRVAMSREFVVSRR